MAPPLRHVLVLALFVAACGEDFTTSSTAGCEQPCEAPDHEGTCAPLPPGSESTCGFFVCNGRDTQCPTACSEESDCAEGAYCDPESNECLQKEPEGSPCEASHECASGQCSSNVCEPPPD